MRKALALMVLLPLLIIGSFAVVLAQPTLPPADPLAFPGAIGYGAEAVCGRGGDVYHVTNLDNSGTGSLRDALEATGPRTVVFDVSGTITLSVGIFIQNPYVTIAGQTAPGGGIQLKMDPSYAGTGSPLTIRTNDVCVHYLKIRPGPGAPAPGGGQPDCVAIASTTDRHAYNIVLNHVSCQWSIDKGIDIGTPWGDPTAFRSHHITVMDSIIAQNLHCATHDEGCHSKGMTAGGKTHTISVIGNLWAANHERQPLIHSTDRVDVINNYTYNANVSGGGPPSQIKLVHDRNEDGDKQYFNILNNVIVYTDTADHSLPGIMFLQRTDPPPATDTQIYLEGNLGISRTSQLQPQNDEYAYVNGSGTWYISSTTQFLTDTIHPGPARPIWATEDVLDQIVAHAGANQRLDCDGSWLWNRDIIDTQVISQVLSGTITLIDDPSEVGGWPDLSGGVPCTDTDGDGMFDTWETANGYNTGDPSDRNDDTDGNGYTALEEFLFGVAQ